MTSEPTDPSAGGPTPQSGLIEDLGEELSDSDSRVSLRRLIALITVVAFILALALVVDKEGQREIPASLESLTENFTAMAFEELEQPRPASQLQRWRQPVRVELIGDEAGDWQPDVAALLREFEALTGVPFSPTGRSETNLTIVFSREEFERSSIHTIRPDNVQCVTTTRAGGGGSISGSRILIPDDLPRAAMVKCLSHEMMHALGFQGHPSLLFPSALSNEPSFGALTINDRILIRTLYDPRLKWNMRRSELIATARTVISEMRDRVADSEDVVGALAP